MSSPQLEECIARGEVAVIPTDTVYGLACSAADAQAVERIYALKGRPMEKPAAVMFVDVEVALWALPSLGTETQALLRALLPGGVTFLLPNPDRLFPLACGPDPKTLGIRIPTLSANLSALASLKTPVLQTSANLAGGPDARNLGMVPGSIMSAVDLVIDGGELAGTPSTVVDARRFERTGELRIVREGAVSRESVERARDEARPTR